MKIIKSLLFAALVAAAPLVSATTIEMKVNGLVCAFCAQGIEKAMKGFPATAGVLVSLENRLVAVQLKEGQDIDDARLRKAITEAGYTLVSVQRSEQSLAQIKAGLVAQPGKKAAPAHEHGKEHAHGADHAHEH